jgi:glycerophosphoryl diester phosphodiesterase
MIVIAHRGASAYAPENTAAAFDLGISLGADALETDIRATREGVLVLLHDRDVDRTTNGHGPVAALSREETQSLDAGSWKAPEYAGQRIPTLDWFLERYGAVVPLYLEIKAPGVEAASVEAVRRRDLLDRVVFTSFELDYLKAVARLAPVRTAWLIREWTPAIAAQAREASLYEVSILASALTPDLVREVKGTGLGCRAWGVKDEGLMEQAVGAGVDGMTIDFPDVLLRRLGRPAGRPSRSANR